MVTPDPIVYFLLSKPVREDILRVTFHSLADTWSRKVRKWG